MSDSCKTIENTNHHSNEIDDEPLDPRIQIELERANAATIEINNLETQYDNAEKLFQMTFSHSKERLSTLAKTLGRCVERARPYYDTFKHAEQAQLETQKAAQEYHNAQENFFERKKQLSQIDPLTEYEYYTHMTLKIKQAEQYQKYCEQIHEEKSRIYQDYEHQKILLGHSLMNSINKSRNYFQEKTKAEKELQKQKLYIEDVQKAIVQAKQTYRTALTNLEQISEEIHFKRQNQLSIPLPPREPCVGAEKPIEFLEFPRIDLSDDSSDTELSNAISSTSINQNTTYFSCSSTQFSSLTSNKSINHSSTPMITSTINRNENLLSDKNSSNQIQRRIIITTKNETPLLSHLFRIQKCHSDSNLCIHT